MLEIYCLAGSNYLLLGIKSSSKTNIPSNGQTHGAPYRGYGYVPLRFGGRGNVVRRMGTHNNNIPSSGRW